MRVQLREREGPAAAPTAAFRLTGAAAGCEGVVGMPAEGWRKLRQGARDAALQALVGAVLRLAVCVAPGSSDGGHEGAPEYCAARVLRVEGA